MNRSTSEPLEKPSTFGFTQATDDPRLLAAVREFVADCEAGHDPNRREFVERYPDFSDALNLCLEGLELIQTAGLRQVQAGKGEPHDESFPVNPLGDFRINREIGRGGMGVVYEAVQLSLGRRVALKVLPFAATFDTKQLQRFHYEAQAAAQLHHPNIVPVYAVGCERGVHFYAMQLIHGQSLAVLIRQLREKAGLLALDAAGSPSRPTELFPPASKMPAPLSGDRDVNGRDEDTTPSFSAALSTRRSHEESEYYRSVARFGVQAAEALEHAHQMGIVHRDIKPGNLLVDACGNLWITDFGLAQFHAETGLTRTGDILGTLQYMSPEQASGERVVLNHRTDVYSLGATLYELATLEPMFNGRSRQELLWQIGQDEPRPPRAVKKSVPVELETILLKAVAKNPEERYASAREFGADLRRYLDNEPIWAKRPTVWDRTRKWSRRHPSWVIGGMVVLGLCAAGLLVSNWMVSAEQAKTAKRAEQAEKRLKQAREAVNLLVAVTQDELDNSPPMQAVRWRLLLTALAYYQDFIEQQDDDAAAQAELERERSRVSRILEELLTLENAQHFDWIAEPSVQRDLKLTDTQQQQIAMLSEEWPDGRPDRRDGPPRARSEEDRRRLLERAQTTERALGNILDAAQLRRFKQITLQMQGPIAFHTPQVTDALGLTAQQRSTIRQLKEDAMAQMGPGARGGDPHGGPQRIDQVMKRELDEILKILTPSQLEKWRELTGDRFERPVNFPPMGPPRGPERERCEPEFKPPMRKHGGW